MEQFMFSTPTLDWTLFLLGWVSLLIGGSIVIATNLTYIIFFISLLIWGLILLFSDTYNPFFLPIMLSFAAIASFFVIINWGDPFASKQTKTNKFLLALFALYCGLYTVNDWAFAQQQEDNTNIAIYKAKQQEALFKKELETKNICRSLDVAKFKAEGGEQSFLDTCEKLKQSQKQHNIRK